MWFLLFLVLFIIGIHDEWFHIRYPPEDCGHDSLFIWHLHQDRVFQKE